MKKLFVLKIYHAPSAEPYEVVGKDKSLLHKFANSHLKNFWTIGKYSLIESSIPMLEECVKYRVMKKHLTDDMKVFRIFDKEIQKKSDVFIYYTITPIEFI